MSLEAWPLGFGAGLSGVGLFHALFASAVGGALVLVARRSMSTSAALAAALVFGGLAFGHGASVPTGVAGWIGIVGVAIVATVIAVTTFLVGLQAIGPTRASVFSTFEPVTAVVLGALFLSEPIGVWTAVGGALILGGAFMLVRSGHPTPGNGKAD